MSNGWQGGSTTRWRALRLYVLERDRWLCRIGTAGVCLGRATCVDHVVPKAVGGEDHEANLRAACEPCNLARERDRIRARSPEPRPRPVSRW